MFKFSIREIFLLTAIAGLCLGWSLSYTTQRLKIRRLEAMNITYNSDTHFLRTELLNTRMELNREGERNGKLQHHVKELEEILAQLKNDQ